jgi:hypothetical protein
MEYKAFYLLDTLGLTLNQSFTLIVPPIKKLELNSN